MQRRYREKHVPFCNFSQRTQVGSNVTAVFKCEGPPPKEQGPDQGDIVSWQTLQFLKEKDDISVKVENDADVFRLPQVK